MYIWDDSEEYRKTVGASIMGEKLTWESKIWSKDSKEYSQSPAKKVRKINFKVSAKEGSKKSMPELKLTMESEK